VVLPCPRIASTREQSAASKALSAQPIAAVDSFRGSSGVACRIPLDWTYGRGEAGLRLEHRRLAIAYLGRAKAFEKSRIVNEFR